MDFISNNDNECRKICGCILDYWGIRLPFNENTLATTMAHKIYHFRYANMNAKVVTCWCSGWLHFLCRPSPLYKTFEGLCAHCHSCRPKILVGMELIANCEFASRHARLIVIGEHLNFRILALFGLAS